MNNIVIKNTSKLEGKKEQFKSDGLDKLHILADFDRTLTKAFVNEKDVPSIISILRDHNYLTPDYPQKAHALYNKYYPIEIDPQVSNEEKRQAMLEWWTKHFELLIKSGLAKKDITSAMTSGNIKFRAGTKEFFSVLQKKNIPLVILSSSGIGNYSIQTLLEHENCLSDNVYIISNRFEWDDQGKAIAVKQPIIHGLNKDETVIKDFPVYEKIKHRKNVILLGDVPADVDMVKGFEYENLITVGFLNKETDKYLEEYKKCFDVIIPDDGPIDYVNELLHEIK